MDHPTITASREATASGVPSVSGETAAPAQRAPRPRAGERARDAVITVLGVLGAAALLWLLAGGIFGVSIIVFMTGSMSPTMPTGAAAIVQTVPAADLQVGDVVTVARRDTGTPVTHRIVEIADGREAAERILTLRGDDNDFADSERYAVSEAPRVVVSAPGVGWVIMAARHPAVTVTLAAGIAAAIVWALWPSRRARGESPPAPSGA